MSITPLIDTEDACFDLNASRPIAKGDLKWRDALLVAHRVNSNETFEKRKKVIYDFICDDFYVPMKVKKKLRQVPQVSKEQRESFRKCWMHSLKKERLHFLKAGKSSKGRHNAIIKIFQANIRGFGFVMVEGEDEDIFYSAGRM